MEDLPELRKRLKITNHAVDRFRERVRNPGDFMATRREILACMEGAKPKTLRKACRKKAYVPLGCCILICESRKVVTIIGRDLNGKDLGLNQPRGEER